MKTLTKPEWAVMSVLWENSPLYLSELIEKMGDSVSWNYNTYSSYLRKLHDKGHIGFTVQRRDKQYYPITTKSECTQTESRELLQKIQKSTAKEFLVCMIKDSKLSQEDAEELKSLLDELSGQGDDL